METSVGDHLRDGVMLQQSPQGGQKRGRVIPGAEARDPSCAWSKYQFRGSRHSGSLSVATAEDLELSIARWRNLRISPGRERRADCLFRNVRLYNRNHSRWCGQMASESQRKATSAHRRRAAARGLVRLEVQAPRKDVELVRMLVGTLRGEHGKANALRSALEKALVNPAEMTAFDIFGSALPDEAFAGVFDQPRERDWWKLKL
jgi:hypothetical protein